VIPSLRHSLTPGVTPERLTDPPDGVDERGSL